MLAVGKRLAPGQPEQQTRLTEAFRTLLVRTYSNALTQYRNQRIDFRPSSASSPRTPMCRSAPRWCRPVPSRCSIDYMLEKGDRAGRSST
jgi:phospholipid transport system substrate-binding protein